MKFLRFVQRILMDKKLEIPQSDLLEGAPHPRMSKNLIGHLDSMEIFRKSYQENKLHHAWIISGNKGIGKATLAWQLIKKLMTEAYMDENEDDKSLINIKQIEALSLPNLFLCRRPYDEKTKRLKKFITVDEVRKLKSFFNLSAIENGWRVALIDSADELNKSASNALLKLLEEPPKRSIIIIVAHQIRKLPVTIRSRCRSLRLQKLTENEIEKILLLSGYNTSNLSKDDKIILDIISNGSAGRAITVLNQDGISIFKFCLELLNNFPNFNRKKLTELGYKVKNNINRFNFISSILLLIIARLASISISSKIEMPTEYEKELIYKLNVNSKTPKVLSQIYSDLSKSFTMCEELNLEPMTEIINAFIRIENSLIEAKND